jgi:putative inorganic carbon (hco3(-)) transporter
MFKWSLVRNRSEKPFDLAHGHLVWWMLGAGILFLGLEWVLLSVSPWAVLVSGAGLLLLAVTAMNYQYLWYLGLICMPLSIHLEEWMEGIGLSIPGDLLAVGLLAIFIQHFKRRIADVAQWLNHPLIRWYLLGLVWMFFTSITSELPVVSIKFWLSATWFMVAYLWFSLLLFQRLAVLEHWLWFLGVSTAAVVAFTVAKHALTGFSFIDSYTVMKPFYKEHTAYAASIAIPTVGFILLTIQPVASRKVRIWSGLVAGVLLVGVITSFTRGAWLGVAIALMSYFLMILWQRYKLFFIAAATLLVLGGVVLYNTDLSLFTDQREKGKTFKEHLASVFDTKNNLSNQERINRWVAAINMFQEQPIFGFGPGTYAMTYAPHQEAQFRTFVSTNRGYFGTAHSEYLLALCEMGIPGLVITLLIYIWSIIYAVQGYNRSNDPRIKLMYAISLCGLITFYAHALVNNFMDQDKVAIPVYLCVAQIIALDLYHNPRQSIIRKRGSHYADDLAAGLPVPPIPERINGKGATHQ